MVTSTAGVAYISVEVSDETSIEEEPKGIMPVRPRHKIASERSVKPNERAKYCSKEVS